MLDAIITKQQEAVLKEERSWLAELQLVLAGVGASEEDRETLVRSTQQLEELFLLVVVGEFNAGKSAFINALLGQSILKEGVTPTTTEINVLRYGEAGRHAVDDSGFLVVTAPAEILRHLQIVDTPGTNAIIRAHQAITEDFVPRSDLVLFVTSADRPFTESERAFLARIQEWGKKVVWVVNKIDILETPEEVTQVVEFVRRNAAAMLEAGPDPDVFPVSSRLAVRAKAGQAELWDKSGFEQLEEYVRNLLHESTRLRLKFLNPLGIADRLIQSYSDATAGRLGLLAGDVATIDNLDRQLDVHRQDMQKNFELRLAGIDNTLHEMEKRATAYFDETMRLGNILDLLNRRRIRKGFEGQVVADTPEQVELKVTEMIDWLVAADLKMWQQVMGYLEKRRQAHSNELIGSVDSDFRYDRDRLIESVGKEAKNVVQTYDKSGEARSIAEHALLAVAGTATGVGAGLGLGAAVTAMATTAAADVTGILAAGVLAALGLLVIPARRRAVKKTMNERVARLSAQLKSALTSQFDKELQRSLQRITDAIAPYTRFVRAQRQKLEEAKSALEDANRQQFKLRAQVETLFDE
jgi:small GTP-binding protein